MKKILFICVLSAVVITAMVWRAVMKPSRYGTFTAAPKVEMVKVIEEPAAFVGKTVEIDGTVSEQCKAMGCFFFFRSGKETLRVDLQEVAMTAPMKEGHMARVEGQIVPYDGGYQFYASAVEFE